MRLSKRLALCAEMAGGARRLADIGTDHGYIPVYFALRGGMERIAASDIGEGPLASARRSALEAGAEEKIEFILADGLKGLDDGFDTIIIAGMGGDTIIKILEESPFSLAGKRLILQPQTRTDRLFSWLFRHDILPERAELCADAGKLYAVFSCIGGEPWPAEPTGAELFGAGLLKTDPLFPGYREKLLTGAKRSLAGLKTTKEPDEKKLRALESLVSELEEM